jgi:hypothetical protein
MIITGKKEVSWRWMFISVLPWSSQYLEGMAMGAAFFFSLYKFIDNPAGLTFILSLPPFIGLLMGPLTHFLSDRVWTRFGRRKIFIITSWCGTLTAMAAMPLMPTFISLLGAYMVFIFFNTMGGPVETLKQEIVPPKQRVTTAAILSWINQFVMLVFYLVALGRFDDEGYLVGLPVSGEESIYWAASLSALIMALLVMLGIKETNPHSSLVGKRLGLKDFFTSILHRNLRQIYILIFGAAVYNVGTGAIGSLLYIEQWQFTKQELGTNVAVGGALNLVIIFVLGLFAKKLPRMKTYQILLVIGMFLNVGFYFYVHFFIYNQRPTLLEIIIFGEMLAIVGTLKGMIYAPLVYDYVPRNEMGTYAAGASIINRLVNMLLLNGAGLFIIVYSQLFLPQGGEMVRISLPEMQHEEAVAALVQEHQWLKTDGQTPYDNDEIFALAWYGNGAALPEGRTFELIFRNPDSEALFEERKKLRSKNNPIKAKAANARALAALTERNGDVAEAEKLRAKAETYDVESAPLEREIEAITAKLDARSEAIKKQVLAKLGDAIMDEGDQFIDAKTLPARTYDWTLDGPPDSRRIEKGLDLLRQTAPGVIDLRVRKENDSYLLRLSVESPDDGDHAAAREAIHAEVEEIFAKQLAGVWQSGQHPVGHPTEAIQLHLRVAEDPLDQHPSPIMRATYWLVDIVAEPPRPERRVYGFARNLRSEDVARHVRVLPGEDHSIFVTAVVTPPIIKADPATDPSGTAADDAPDSEAKSAEMSPAHEYLSRVIGTPEAAALAARLYQRTVDLGGANFINVTRPYSEHRFSERQYDYMASYIWMLVLDFIGILITIDFVRRERKGLIRKRGVEEMEAIS